MFTLNECSPIPSRRCYVSLIMPDNKGYCLFNGRYRIRWPVIFHGLGYKTAVLLDFVQLFGWKIGPTY